MIIKYFPIIILNDWKELDVNKLVYSDIDHKYLDIEFINKMITNTSDKQQILENSIESSFSQI